MEVVDFKYADVLDSITNDTFSRQDVLDAILQTYPDYNTNSFDRHFSRLLNSHCAEGVGENVYIRTKQGEVRRVYTHDFPSDAFLDVESFLTEEFPLADFIAWEITQLNEFVLHLLAKNTIFVMVEHILMDNFFYRLQDKNLSVLISPSADDIMRYAGHNTIIIDRLTSRYPKNKKQQHRISIEKLIVDLFAEKTVCSMVSSGDYPTAMETMFDQYRINETRLFNYARARCVDDKIRNVIRDQTNIRLYTDRGK